MGLPGGPDSRIHDFLRQSVLPSERYSGSSPHHDRFCNHNTLEHTVFCVSTLAGARAFGAEITVSPLATRVKNCRSDTFLVALPKNRRLWYAEKPRHGRPKLQGAHY